MFLRNLSAALLGCALLAAPASAFAASRGPSTPEERKQALDYIQHYMADPLDQRDNQEKAWLMQWLVDIPDVEVHVCSILDKLPKGDKKDGFTIFLAEMFSQTAFLLQNPDKKDDRQAEFLAGVEGALRVYEVLLKSNPKDRQPFLDDLIQRRDAGTLVQFIQERLTAGACHK